MAQELLDNRMVNRALSATFETRERATRAQELAMSALNLPSAGDLERLTRRLRSVSQRLETIEDGLDRIEQRIDQLGSSTAIEKRLAAIEEVLARLEAAIDQSAAAIDQSAAAIDQSAAAIDQSAAAPAAVASEVDTRGRTARRSTGSASDSGTG